MIIGAIKLGGINYETVLLHIFFRVSRSNQILPGVNTKNKVHIL